MIDEKDLRKLLISAELKRWYELKIKPAHGWLYDWDSASVLARESRFFLAYLKAFDVDARREYLEKRRKSDAADDFDKKFDETFLLENFDETRRRGQKNYAKKVAAIYFHFDEELLDWRRDVWLSLDEEWSYRPERDDRFLATILMDPALRVKAPDVVQNVFVDWVLPFVGTLTFKRAKRFGYTPEEFAGDAYTRLCGRDGRRKLFANGVEYWLRQRPTATLRNWCELEAYRVIHAFIQRRRREKFRTSVNMGDGVKRVGANAAQFDENETSPLDMQTLFDNFAKRFPAKAHLIASYLSSGAPFDSLASFWNLGREKKIDGASLGQRTRRTLDDWRSDAQQQLALGAIPKKSWQEIFHALKKEARTDDKKTTEEEKEEKEPNLAGAPKSAEWRKRVRFLADAAPTEDDATLFKNFLESRRIDETGCFSRLFAEKTQRMGLTPLVREQAARRDKPSVVPRQNSLRASGSPNVVPVAKILRRYWRHKYAPGRSISFYYESAEAPGTPGYWIAQVRVPLFAEPDAEIGLTFFGYDPLKSWPTEIAFGNKKIPVVCGVAVFKLFEFRIGIERNLPQVTMLLRRVENRRGEARWHVKRKNECRILYRKPVVPDDE